MGFGCRGVRIKESSTIKIGRSTILLLNSSVRTRRKGIEGVDYKMSGQRK